MGLAYVKWLTGRIDKKGFYGLILRGTMLLFKSSDSKTVLLGW
jgi:hypothetical protein